MNHRRTKFEKAATPGCSRRSSSRERGFVLITALLLLLLLTIISIGLLMMVNSETTAGANDLQNNIAYHAAEGGIEKMTADLSAVFTTIQAPKAGDLTAIESQLPNIPGITWQDYKVTPAENPDGSLKTFWGTISSGPNQGLNAQIIPVTLMVTAQAPTENQVTMVRTAEIALIPVFQFGVFSDSDLGFFNSPDMDFAGRVHTNGDLYLGVSASNKLTFHDKLSAYGNVIRAVLPNGLSSASYGNTGVVKIPTANAGCDTGNKCRAIGIGEGSVTGGPKSSQNGIWPNISKNTYNGEVIDGNYGQPGGTGATDLTLPFTGGGTQPFEIIRRAPAGESTASMTSQSRLMNRAEIRIFLSDDPNDLPGGANDPQNIRLANVQTMAGAPDYSNGVPTSTSGVTTYTTYFAEASTAVEDSSQWSSSASAAQWALPPDWSILPKTLATMNSGAYNWPLQNYMVKPTPVSSDPAQPVGTVVYSSTSSLPGYAPFITADPTGQLTPMRTAAQLALEKNGTSAIPTYNAPPAQPTTWNLIDGYLRVEYRDASGVYHPVTQEWLELGFARGVNAPTTAGGNTVNPNAILIFQEAADRNGDGTLDLTGGTQVCSGTGTSQKCYIPKPPELAIDPVSGSAYTGTSSETTSVTRNNWYPINFYDPREGESRDNVNSLTAGSCSANGVMNAVELDVGNLKAWLATTTGQDVDFNTDNGYILYYSDRRGMLNNPNAGNVKTGDAGLEDVINTSSKAGTPDGTLETPGGTASPEDVNENGVLDNFGPWDMGLGFGNDLAGNPTNNDIVANSSAPNPFVRFANCQSTGRKNWVSGARHVLRLVDGSLGQVPTKPDGTGGFTIASENPVYILGNYNSNSTDQTWTNPSATDPAHSAAAIIADSVTLLSNNWQVGGDMDSFAYPFGNQSCATNSSCTSRRPAASTTYYRVAIAAGKNKVFPATSYASSTILYGFGTDGGVHNFLRFLEDWSGVSAYYKGSLVSLFYSTYDTGVFKCCGDAVYHPPIRNFSFDPLFSQPQNLPPGTPMFRDVDNLSYRQDFTPR